MLWLLILVGSWLSLVQVSAAPLAAAPAPVIAGQDETHAAPHLPAPKTPAAAAAALQQALNVRPTGSNTFQLGLVEFDAKQRLVIIPSAVNLRTQVVEYALVAATGKAYESLLTTQARPADMHLACLLLGLEPAAVTGRRHEAMPVPATNAVDISVTWETNGMVVRRALSELIRRRVERTPEKPARPLAPGPWFYNGSFFGEMGFAAQQEGSMVSLIRDPSALVNNPRDDRDNHDIHWPEERLLPPAGWPVRVELRLPPPQP